MDLRATFLALATLGATLSAGVTTTEPTAEPVAAVAGVTGTISFRGEKADAKRLDIKADPVCVDGNPDGLFDRTLTVSEKGGLADVFIQLTGVPDEKYKAPKDAAVLDQKGCRYHPFVFGVMVKQDIQIVNSDDTLHNVHAVPKRNKEFNNGMPTKGQTIKKKFKKAEDAVLIKCDVHPWMKAYCFVIEHPYFATTTADGTFTLPTDDLPDGEYGVTLWHPKLGDAEGKVTVKGGAGKFEHAFGG